MLSAYSLDVGISSRRIVSWPPVARGFDPHTRAAFVLCFGIGEGCRAHAGAVQPNAAGVPANTETCSERGLASGPPDALASARRDRQAITVVHFRTRIAALAGIGAAMEVHARKGSDAGLGDIDARMDLGHDVDGGAAPRPEHEAVGRRRTWRVRQCDDGQAVGAGIGFNDPEIGSGKFFASSRAGPMASARAETP